MASLRFAPPEARGRAADPGQRAIPCLFMRGGSSRGGFFLAADMPADALTSKAAIVGPATRPDADVDYTFAQVSTEAAPIGVGGTCGSMLAGVGPFAILRGLVPARESETVLRIHATNTGQVIIARVPVLDDAPAIEGTCQIAGVRGTAARIGLDFGDCAGAVSGRLLPTGQTRDEIEVDGRRAQVSLVDAATPFVFVRAADFGARGAESAAEIAADAVAARTPISRSPSRTLAGWWRASPRWA